MNKRCLFSQCQNFKSGHVVFRKYRFTNSHNIIFNTRPLKLKRIVLCNFSNLICSLINVWNRSSEHSPTFISQHVTTTDLQMKQLKMYNIITKIHANIKWKKNAPDRLQFQGELFRRTSGNVNFFFKKNSGWNVSLDVMRTFKILLML